MIRPLGYNELYELAQYTLGHGRGVTTSCRYAIPAEIAGSDEELKRLVYTAIRRVILESPVLRVGIEGALSKRPVWVHLATMNLEYHVAWVTLDTAPCEQFIQERIGMELDAEYPDLETRPGWRVVIFRHASHDFLDVVFIWNHANTDGMGGKIFHDRLLKALTEEHGNNSAADMDDMLITLPDSIEQFPPVTEELVKLPMSLGWMLKQAWTESKPSFLFPNPNLATWAPVKSSPYKSHFRTCTVSNTILSGILAACRSHNTTITALLHSLLLFSLASRTNEKQASGFISLSALDVRRFLPSNPPSHPWFDPKKTMANYVSNMSHDFDSALVSQVRAQITDDAQASTLMDNQLDLLWSVASRIRRDLQQRLDRGLKDDRISLMKFVPNAREMFKKELQKPRTLSWGISNLGVMDVAPCEENSNDSQSSRAWKISRAQFTLSTHLPEAALLLGAITVKGGEMVITCTWQDTAVDTALAECIVEDTQRWLYQIGKSSEAAP